MLKSIPWVVAAAVSVLLAPTARATPTLSMDLITGGSTVALTNSSHTGVITYDSGLGVFTIDVVTGTGVGTLNPGAGNTIDLSSINVTSAAAGTLTIKLTETGLTGAAAATAFTSAIGGTLGSIGKSASSLLFTTYVDPTDTAFGTTTQTFSDNFSGSGKAFSAKGNGIGTISGPYSETIILTLTAAANSETSLDAFLTPAPEPASLAILGVGMLALGMVRRRRPKDGSR
jgi:hypothetical protein